MSAAARLQSWRDGLAAGLGRFPVAALALAAFTVVVNVAIAEWGGLGDENMLRLGALSITGAMLSAAVVLAAERRAFSTVSRAGLSLLPLIAVALLVAFERPLGVSLVALFGIAALALPLAPYVGFPRQGQWAFVARLAIAAILSFAAVGIFCAGLSAILASLHYLFDLPLPDEAFGHVWATGLCFVGPVVALSMIPRRAPEQDTHEGLDILVVGGLILSDFVAIPLVAVYALLLHAYAAKIVLTADVPRNQIGWMVLGFAAAILALRVAVHPFREGRLPTRLFLRFWAVLLAVPTGLLAYAIWLRIDAYGVTPQRYALALGAVYLGLLLLAQLDARLRGDLRVIGGLALACLAFASVGPWGAIQASGASQEGRLNAALAEAGALDAEGRFIGKPAWTADAAAEAQSALWALESIDQLDRLRPLFAGASADPFNPSADEFRARRRPYRHRARHRRASGQRAGPDLILDRNGRSRRHADRRLRSRRQRPVLGEHGGPRGVRGRRDGPGFPRSPEHRAAQGEPLTVTAADLRPAIEARLDDQAAAAAPGKPGLPLFVELQRGSRRVMLVLSDAGGERGEDRLTLDSGRVDLYCGAPTGRPRRASPARASCGRRKASPHLRRDPRPSRCDSGRFTCCIVDADRVAGDRPTHLAVRCRETAARPWRAGAARCPLRARSAPPRWSATPRRSCPPRTSGAPFPRPRPRRRARAGEPSPRWRAPSSPR